MLEILTSLDNREIATAVWLGIFICWCLSKPAIRKSLFEVVRIATAKPLAIAFGVAIAYLVAVTIALHSIDLWTLRQLKITVLWFVVAGIPALADTPEISKNPALLRSSIAKNFKLSLLLDFFINLFKLPLTGELIFVPFTALIGGLLAVAQGDEKYAPVQKLLNAVLIFIGVAFFVFEIYEVTTSFGSIAKFDTLRDFVLPITYNLAFVPLLWGMAIYAAYESVFCRLGFVIRDATLHSYARRKLILGFRTDIAALNLWFKGAWSGAFVSRNDIAKSITTTARSRDAA